MYKVVSPHTLLLVNIFAHFIQIEVTRFDECWLLKCCFWEQMSKLLAVKMYNHTLITTVFNHTNANCECTIY